MRRSFLFIIFATLTVSPSLGLQTAKTWYEVNLSVKGVKFDTSYANVRRRFGKPLYVEIEKSFDETCGPPSSRMTLRYSGLVIELQGNIEGRDFRVVSVDVSTPKWLIAPGLRVGMNEREVRARLGQPYEEADESGLHRLAYVSKGNDGGAALYFRSGRLVRIQWEVTLC